eukprot:scaffold69568_cov35-Prasinocladus_malaysianus.AAC.2
MNYNVAAELHRASNCSIQQYTVVAGLLLDSPCNAAHENIVVCAHRLRLLERVVEGADNVECSCHHSSSRVASILAGLR